MAVAHRPRRVHVGDLADRERAGADHPRALRDEGHGDRDDHVLDAGTEGRDHRQRHDDEGEGEEHVHDALDHQIEDPAEVGAGDPQDQPERRPEERGHQPDEQGGARAVEDTGQDVAAELVGAHDELGVRGGEHVLQRVPLGVEGSEDLRESRGEGHDDHHQRPRGPQGLLPGEGPQAGAQGLLQILELTGVDEGLRRCHGFSPPDRPS